MGILRFILALSVVIDHIAPAGFRLLPAQPAVLIFFILSGFYMTLVIDTKYQHQINGTRNFYFNRFLRLYPSYFFVLVISLLYKYMFDQPDIFINPDPSIAPIRRITYILVNLTIIGQDILSVDPVFHQFANHPVSIAWTLGTECLFYLMAPFLLLLQNRKSTYAFAVLFCGSLVIRFVLLALTYHNGGVCSFDGDTLFEQIVCLLKHSDPGRYRFFPSVLIFFLMGSIAYRLYRVIQGNPRSKKIGKIICIGGLIVLVIRVAFAGKVFNTTYIVDIDAWYYWLLYLAVFLGTPFIFSWSKDIAVDNYLGKLSYPLYIGQNISIVIALVMVPSREGTMIFPIIAFAISLFIGMLLHAMVESPLSALRKE